MSLDFDGFYSDLHSINSYLCEAVNERNSEVFAYLRSRYSIAFIKKFRMILAALRSEENLTKMGKLSKLTLDIIPASNLEFDNLLQRIAYTLNSLKEGPVEQRERVRKRIGIFKLGELSTLLKAAFSDNELERYLRGKKLLQKITSSANRDVLD